MQGVDTVDGGGGVGGWSWKIFLGPSVVHGLNR